jgi:NAD(P)-dependent dehydrogenase (short-subunit alcohol dehydrogenase family)
MKMKNEHVLITGGGSGLGLGMAKSFAAAGARVTIIGRRKDVLLEAKQQITGRIAIVDGDVKKDGASIVERAVKEFGPVTVLVNNAGVHIKKSIIDMTDDDFRSVLDTHLTAAISLTRLVVPSMIERKHGALLFIASMTALLGMPNVVAYSAAKSATTGIVRALAVELGGNGIRVNAIAPGWIESPMLHKALDGDPARKNRILQRTPMGKFGEPDDIGNAAVFLCGDTGKFINGVVLPVDGGAVIGF